MSPIYHIHYEILPATPLLAFNLSSPPGRKVVWLLAIGQLIQCSARSLRAQSPPGCARTRVSFDANWRFIKGDPADANGATLAYAQMKADLLANVNYADYVVRPTAEPTNARAKTSPYAKPDFNDSSWRQR